MIVGMDIDLAEKFLLDDLHALVTKIDENTKDLGELQNEMLKYSRGVLSMPR